MTFEETYIHWTEYKRRLVKESTMAAYKIGAINHLIPYFADKPVGEINRKIVQSFVYKKLDAGLSKKSVQDLLIILKMIVRFASEEFDIPTLTNWRIDWPSCNMDERPELPRYTPDEFNKIVSYALENPSIIGLAVLITITSGMRIGEVCALQFKDIDMEKKIIHVTKTMERIYEPFNKQEGGKASRIIVSEPKTKSSRRDIPIMRNVLPLLKKFHALARPDYYICSMSEHCTEPRTMRNHYFVFITEKVGLKRCVKFHGLRHTFASTLIENKVDVKTVSSILGHSDVSTTLNVYVHPSEETKRNAINTALKKTFK